MGAHTCNVSPQEAEARGSRTHGAISLALHLFVHSLILSFIYSFEVRSRYIIQAHIQLERSFPSLTNAGLAGTCRHAKTDAPFLGSHVLLQVRVPVESYMAHAYTVPLSCAFSFLSSNPQGA